MTRNLDRIIQKIMPITNPTVHEQVLDQIMVANYKDTSQSWFLNKDDNYVKIKSSKNNEFSAHNYFMKNPSLSGRGQASSLNMPQKITIN